MKTVSVNLGLGDKDVIFFDGVCNLCNGFVQFVIKHDKTNRFYFSSLQSAQGIHLLKSLPQTGKTPDSIMLYSKDSVYSESTAVLRIMGQLSGILPVAGIFLVVPKFIRDVVYKWVARNRYRWFGKMDSCMIPTPALKQKFID